MDGEGMETGRGKERLGQWLGGRREGMERRREGKEGGGK